MSYVEFLYDLLEVRFLLYISINYANKPNTFNKEKIILYLFLKLT